MELLKSLQARLDNLTLQERGILLLAVIAITFFAFDFLLMQPLAFKQQRVNTQIRVNNAELIALATETDQIVKEGTEDPNIAKKAELQQLQRELRELDAELGQTMDRLVPPGDMSRLLEMVLRRTPGLELRKVQSLGSQPLRTKDSSDPGTDDTEDMENATVGNVFRHGLRIEFDGDFASTLNYLKTLEGLEWKFFWDTIDYQVDEYPVSSVAITVFTINTNEHWIGL